MIWQAIRNSFGGNSIEKNAGEEAVKLGSQVDEHFMVTKRELEFKRKAEKEGKNGVKKKVVETFTKEKDICHAVDASDYIKHLLKLRGLDPMKTLIRLGIDGGQGSLKILVSVFDPTATGEAPLNWMELDPNDIQGIHSKNRVM